LGISGPLVSGLSSPNSNSLSLSRPRHRPLCPSFPPPPCSGLTHYLNSSLSLSLSLSFSGVITGLAHPNRLRRQLQSYFGQTTTTTTTIRRAALERSSTTTTTTSSYHSAGPHPPSRHWRRSLFTPVVFTPVIHSPRHPRPPSSISYCIPPSSHLPPHHPFTFKLCPPPLHPSIPLILDFRSRVSFSLLPHTHTHKHTDEAPGVVARPESLHILDRRR
jgi:hypothetical protein